MLAVVVERPDELVIKQVEKPIINKDEVLIKVLASSICNATDNHILDGTFDGASHDHYPQILGHEVCGEIVEVGANVTELSLGQRIVFYTNRGAFCEYVSVNALVEPYGVLPENMEPKVATCCEMFHGAYLGVVANANLNKNENVLVIGGGPMGLTTMACAKLFAKTVSIVDLFENRLNIAKEMGADFTYNRSTLSAKEIVEQIIKNTGNVDIVLMCISEDRTKEFDAYNLAIDALKAGGRITGLICQYKGMEKNQRINSHYLHMKDIMLKYHHKKSEFSQRELFQQAVDFVAEGKVPLEKLITHEVTFSQLPYALDLCINHLDEVIKVIVYPKI